MAHFCLLTFLGQLMKKLEKHLEVCACPGAVCYLAAVDQWNKLGGDVRTCKYDRFCWRVINFVHTPIALGMDWPLHFICWGFVATCTDDFFIQHFSWHVINYYSLHRCIADTLKLIPSTATMSLWLYLLLVNCPVNIDPSGHWNTPLPWYSFSINVPYSCTCVCVNQRTLTVNQISISISMPESHRNHRCCY